MKKLCASILALPLALPCIAAEEEKKLEAELELGVIVTSGNTKTQSFKGKFDIKQNLTHWRNRYIVEGLSKRDQIEVTDEDGNEENLEQTTAEKYFASAQGDYKLNKEHAALFILGEYDRNRFSGYDYQYTIAAGFTNRLFTTDNSYLSYDIGPGVSVDQVETVEGEDEVDKEETFIIRFAAEYLYQISENAKFTQNVSTNYATDSENNTKTKSVSALTAQLNSSFALRASFTVDYNSEVTEGLKHADTETAVTVVYSF